MNRLCLLLCRTLFRRLHRCRWAIVLCAWCLCLPGWTQALAQDCAPRMLSVLAAEEAGPGALRPAQGWVPVTLPDMWSRRWPGHDGAAWYRIEWERGCAASAGPVALGLDGISMAGEVFINDDLLWRDASLVEPLSRSWNMPRWWLLPESSLHEGVNTIWVRVVGLAALSPGLGALRLGSPQAVAQRHAQQLWQQRTLYFINAVLSAVAAALFLLVWCLRRQEQAYGWFGLMCLGWLLYLTTFVADTPWPWSDTLTKSRVSLVALVWYVLCACLLTFRFGGQRLPFVERALWVLATLGAVASLVVPQAVAGRWFTGIWLGAMGVFLANCLQFQWHAWRPRPEGRQRRYVLLAMCWMVFVVVAVHDLSGVLGVWQVARSWATMSGLLIISLMVLLLGGQLAQQMRGMERFNQELAAHVAGARAELARAAAREHAQALENARLQERMRIAHDLHDGLGGSLVRSMALVEQAPQPLPSERVLSLLKLLRDDLRQVIDQGSSAGAAVPRTPVHWAAPLRHRFTRILDELGVSSRWDIAAQWRQMPSALQCLGLTRLVEEALSNAIKHSRARHVHVQCTQPGADLLVVRIEDDGVGFDVEAVRRAGLSVGMRSMAARAERIGGVLTVESGPGATVVRVEVALQPQPALPSQA
ncbi:nitrate/nitrite sensor protein NarQ [Delftia tsuruhatensis]|nr:nitrate/nitrite sensor protein NarQ [Delftia tsuruhatensis]CAC9687347.1 nitrate/nitrite sensor protein NarQ [Delftia tsuruhatensis]